MTGTVLVLATACVTPVLAGSAPASADTVVDGCTIVSNPTPSHFTDCPGDNLSGADLSGFDLRYANLAGADFIYGLDLANLSGTDLSNANLSSASLAGVDLSHANLTSANLTSATLVFCFPDFSVTSCVATALSGATLAGATLADVTFATCADSSPAPYGSACGALNFSGIDLSGANFTGATFVACQPPGVSPPSCDGANLTGATLTGANLADIDLTDVNLTGATLTGATLTGAILTGTLLVPSDRTVRAASDAGAVVTWPTPPSLPGATPGTCTPPPSGSTFPLGTTTITCQVLDNQDDVASGSFTVTVVIPVHTITSLSTSPNPSLVGQPVTYTATVSPTPTEGTVSFTDNGSPILGCSGPGVPVSGGIAICTTSGSSTPTRGDHTIVATYGGSVAFFRSTSPSVTQVVVNSLRTTTSLRSSVDPVVLRQSVTYTATVSPAPIGGTVAFTDNGSPIARCTAVSLSGDRTTCSTTPSATGAHAIVASYSGSGGFVGSTSPSLTEVVVPPPPTTSVLLPSNGATASGHSLLDAGASSPVGLASVSFELSGGSLSDQVISGSTPTLDGWIGAWNSTSVPNGTYTLRSVATDVDGVSGTSAPITIMVSNQPPATAVLVPSDGATVSGRSQILDASASSAAGVASVTFEVSGGTRTKQVVATAQPTIYGWIGQWNTTTVPNGTYMLQSMATDTVAETASSIPITITVDNPAPTSRGHLPSTGPPSRGVRTSTPAPRPA